MWKRIDVRDCPQFIGHCLLQGWQGSSCFHSLRLSSELLWVAMAAKDSSAPAGAPVLLASPAQTDKAKDRQNLKQLRSFISYYEMPGRMETDKGQDVGHLAAHFHSLDAEGKKALAKDWATSCGSKGNLRAYLSQTLTVESDTTGGKKRGHMTPTQVAELLSMHLAQLPADELQKTLEAEITANQDLHQVAADKRKRCCMHTTRRSMGYIVEETCVDGSIF